MANCSWALLVPGYAREENGREYATGNTTLIRFDATIILVDPGLDRTALLNGLAREGIAQENVNVVVLTHSHPDHALLAGMFEQAVVLDDTSVYSWDGGIVAHDGKIPGTDITILKTPGHENFHCAVVFKTPKDGTVAVVGDVFWWYDNETPDYGRSALIEKPDPYEKDRGLLRESRKVVLDLADLVIPGHGRPFSVKNDA
jgi:glyoxylase-like metal-dependent hydrolase (beta-lactamase superfamily II)